MELAKSEALKQAIESFKKLYDVDDAEAKKLFIKEYLLEGEEKSTDEAFSEMLHGKKEE